MGYLVIAMYWVVQLFYRHRISFYIYTRSVHWEMFPVFRNDSFIKMILITSAKNNISEKSFSTFKRVKSPILSTMTKSPPSDKYFQRRAWWKWDKDKINELVQVKESRSATFGLHQFRAKIALVQSLCSLSISPKIIRKFSGFLMISRSVK